MKLHLVFVLMTIGLIGLQLARPPEGPQTMRGVGGKFVAAPAATTRESPLAELWDDTRTWVAEVVTGRRGSDLDTLDARQTREMSDPVVTVPDLNELFETGREQARARPRCRCRTNLSAGASR